MLIMAMIWVMMMTTTTAVSHQPVCGIQVEAVEQRAHVAHPLHLPTGWDGSL